MTALHRTHVVVGICLLLIVAIAQPRQAALRYLYPLRYADVLLHEAQKNHVDPLLVAAVARVESRFNPRAVSPKGAIGVMQVMPATASWVASRLHVQRWQVDKLYDPATNIKIGTWYLAYLQHLFRGNQVLAVAAYNGGHANVQKWLSSGTWNGTQQESSRIPFLETREYVARVFRTYEYYKQAYPRVAAGDRPAREGSMAKRTVSPVVALVNGTREGLRLRLTKD